MISTTRRNIFLLWACIFSSNSSRFVSTVLKPLFFISGISFPLNLCIFRLPAVESTSWLRQKSGKPPVFRTRELPICFTTQCRLANASHFLAVGQSPYRQKSNVFSACQQSNRHLGSGKSPENLRFSGLAGAFSYSPGNYIMQALIVAWAVCSLLPSRTLYHVSKSTSSILFIVAFSGSVHRRLHPGPRFHSDCRFPKACPGFHSVPCK